uniref:18 kDa Sin3-associated polypeptide n=1 Tax=Panstrongylus megistus TaxID=65343 RepID=A0A069DNF4_9HEMI
MASAPLESLVRVEERFTERDKPVDREKTCPLLLRVFCCTGRHNNPQEYRGGNVPSNELQIYTWLDATLKEITGLVKEVNEDARARGTMFDFSLVYPHQQTSGYRFRHIGTTYAGQNSADDNRTLSSIRFNIGEFIDVCITPPSRITPMMMRRGGGGMRQY